MKKTHKEYHPAVDGLRAVSILAVVLYHVGVPGIRGGFVGVDVFFVISGFLIISQIARALESGTFSFADFVSRRALRILPPYFLVVFSVALVAPFVLVFPAEHERIGDEIAYSALMLSNFLYLGQEGYFDSSRDTKVLLHLWSLAVEEQFYLIAPIVGLGLHWLHKRFSGEIAFSVFIALGVVSFASCVWFTVGGKNYSFYLMPMRAWEFVLGALAAFCIPYLRNTSILFLQSITVAGLAMVLFSVVFFRASMPYPSYLAVVPALGAALVIAGCLANAKILIARLLSVQPIVFIGLVSYAWYLWHWPLLTYTRIYNFGDRSLVTDGIAAVAALALAIATRYFVEGRIQTWRRGRGAFLSWKPVVVSLLFCSLFAFYGSYYASARNLGSSIPDKMMGTKAGSLGLCDFRDTDNLEKCLTESVSPRMGLILGDSQAASALVTLNEEARRQGRTLIGFGSGGCSALLKTAVVNPNVITSEVCRKSRQNLFAGLEHTKQLEFAILYSAWPIYGSDAQAYRLLGSHDDQDRLFVQGMRDTFDYLVSKGVQRILVIGPTPRFLRDAPNCVSRAILTHQDVDERCSQPVSDFDRDTGRSRSRIAEALEGRTNVRVLNPAATFCDERYCRSYGDQEIWFNDTNHISDYGMRRLIGRNQKLFDWVFGASQSAP